MRGLETTVYDKNNSFIDRMGAGFKNFLLENFKLSSEDESTKIVEENRMNIIEYDKIKNGYKVLFSNRIIGTIFETSINKKFIVFMNYGCYGLDQLVVPLNDWDENGLPKIGNEYSDIKRIYGFPTKYTNDEFSIEDRDIIWEKSDKNNSLNEYSDEFLINELKARITTNHDKCNIDLYSDLFKTLWLNYLSNGDSK